MPRYPPPEASVTYPPAKEATPNPTAPHSLCTPNLPWIEGSRGNANVQREGVASSGWPEVKAVHSCGLR